MTTLTESRDQHIQAILAAFRDSISAVPEETRAEAASVILSELCPELRVIAAPTHTELVDQFAATKCIRLDAKMWDKPMPEEAVVMATSVLSLLSLQSNAVDAT